MIETMLRAIDHCMTLPLNSLLQCSVGQYRVVGDCESPRNLGVLAINGLKAGVSRWVD